MFVGNGFGRSGAATNTVPPSGYASALTIMW
jgi:hypothetical protein